MNIRQMTTFTVITVIIGVVAVVFSQALDIITQDSTDELNINIQLEWDAGTIPLYYACMYGHYEPACDTSAVQPDDIQASYSQFLEMHYACSRGNYAPACNYLVENSSSLNWDSGTIPLYYACTYGNYEPACDASGIESNTTQILTYQFLEMNYACERGNHPPACRYMKNEPIH